MPPFRDIIGEKFGRLTVVKLHHIKQLKRKFYYYLCKCDCGNEIIVLKSSLLNGLTRSCGCYNKEIRSKRMKERAKHHLSEARLYHVWEKLRSRCYCKTNKSFHNYGGRGIKICNEWQNFQTFHEWAYSNGYNENAKYMECTLDRIDVNGNYEPSNCRWVNMKTQNNNRRNNHLITYNNETHTIAEWSEIYNIPYKIFYQRLTRDKMPFERAINVKENKFITKKSTSTTEFNCTKRT